MREKGGVGYLADPSDPIDRRLAEFLNDSNKNSKVAI
jgi:hypothetical protein